MGQIEHSITLLDFGHRLTCNCGRKQWITRLPFRCHDCAAWWWTEEHIEKSKKIIDKPRLEAL